LLFEDLETGKLGRRIYLFG